MPYLKRNSNINIFYREDDFTDPWKNKPTLLLQHGNGRSGNFWYSWIPYLAPHFKIIRADMRGVGRSSLIENPQFNIKIEDCVSDLAALIEHLNISQIYYCGESMGGILGILLAAKYPQYVKSLALIATPIFINQNMKKTYSLGYSSRLEAMKVLGIKDWVRRTSILSRFPPNTDAGLLDWYVDEFSKSDPETLIHYSDLVSSANAAQYLEQIKCPTLAVMPSNGPITDIEQLDLLKKSVCDLKIQTVESDYHMIHLTHVKPCTEIVINFFTQF